MSYSFDGKIANQSPNFRLTGRTSCAKCNSKLDLPEVFNLETKVDNYKVYSYLQTSSFIYETKSGTAVVYCSEYCRNKHNHRFQK